jgi:LuxR family maltose regulon positive regulatory protein
LACASRRSQISKQSSDEPAEANQLFCEVLRAGATTGLYQSILDEGPEIGTLLLSFQDNARRTGVSKDLLPYVGKLIAGWRDLYQPSDTGNVSSDIVESLSPRNILERIGQGRSNKEIARELGIAPETVKSHVKNLFVKLGVDRRAHTVSRAQSLGLVRM